MEAEGSGPVWGVDVGSGSGDIVGNEDLLRVSTKGLGEAGVRALGGKVVGQAAVTVGWPLGNCWLLCVEVTIHSPLLHTCLIFPPRFQ